VRVRIASPLPRRILLDSSGYLALISTRDAHHLAATEAINLIAREQWHTFTSTYVIAEAHALFLTRLGHDPAILFLRQFEKTSTLVLQVRPADVARAHEIIYQYDDKNFSLTDATSFVLIERLRIGAALTTDGNFAQYGFQMLGIAH
jgi:predicted nucleic acid-binding protein